MNNYTNYLLQNFKDLYSTINNKSKNNNTILPSDNVELIYYINFVAINFVANKNSIYFSKYSPIQDTKNRENLLYKKMRKNKKKEKKITLNNFKSYDTEIEGYLQLFWYDNTMINELLNIIEIKGFDDFILFLNPKVVYDKKNKNINVRELKDHIKNKYETCNIIVLNMFYRKMLIVLGNEKIEYYIYNSYSTNIDFIRFYNKNTFNILDPFQDFISELRECFTYIKHEDDKNETSDLLDNFLNQITSLECINIFVEDLTNLKKLKLKNIIIKDAAASESSSTTELTKISVVSTSPVQGAAAESLTASPTAESLTLSPTAVRDTRDSSSADTAEQENRQVLLN